MTTKEYDNSRLSEERAIIALLCGHLRTLEDHFLAHLRAMIDHSVKKELCRCVNYKRQLQILFDEYWNQQLTIESIFTTLATTRDVVAQSRQHYWYQSNFIHESSVSKQIMLLF